MKPFLRSVASGGLFVAGLLALRAADGPATFKVSELTFSRPEKWEWVPTQSSMRKAQLRVPNTAGDPGEIIFYYFGAGGAGATQANVERWFRQFEGGREASHGRTEEGKAGGDKVTYVHAEGTYLSGMPGGPQTPKAGYALLGAIIEDAGGSVFVRFTGPKDVVQGATDEFKKMIGSAKSG